jgi:hypothetical protein
MTWSYCIQAACDVNEDLSVFIAVQLVCQANPATPPEAQLLLWLQSSSAMPALWLCGHTLREAPVSLLHPWYDSGMALTVLAHLGIAYTIFGGAEVERCHCQRRWIEQVRFGDSILWRFNSGYEEPMKPSLRVVCSVAPSYVWIHASPVQFYCHVIYFFLNTQKKNVMSVFDYLGCQYRCDIGTPSCGWLFTFWKSKIFHVVHILVFDTENRTEQNYLNKWPWFNCNTW